MANYDFTVVYDSDEDGRIVAICPTLQGCYAEGETLEEAEANIREAIEAHVQSRLKRGETIPPEVRSEKVSLVL
jgi:predicted RNase H-like HicB family nuclease